MRVQNFECQIARAQITRYLAGESLGEDMLLQLESHVAKCSDCRLVLEQRKAALQSLVQPSDARKDIAVVEVAEDRPTKPTLRDWIIAKLPKPKAAEGKSITKPALYAGGLAVVLIGMSYFSSNLTNIMGPRANETLSNASEIKPPTTSGSISSLPAKNAVPKKQATPAAKPEDKPASVKPAPALEITRKPISDNSAPRKSGRAVKRTTSPKHSAPEPSPAKDTIRVYEAQ